MTSPSSFPWTADPEIADLVAATLITSLVERHGAAFGATMTEALLYAIRRLLEDWVEGEDGDSDDGPFSLDDPDETRTQGNPGTPLDPTSMFQ